MGTVVIHAGMPKTGSTSIQGWLQNSAAELRRERDVRILVATPRERPTPEVRVAPYRIGGRLHSAGVIRLARNAKDARSGLAEDLCAQIDAHAERHETVLITSESFAQMFWQVQEAFLRALDELARRHVVRVGYYVRPQHTALEAAWRQWGFRSSHPPARYIEKRSRQLHYIDTYEVTRRKAPRISFEPRPFRTDLLEGGDVVVDFARHFLGVDPAEVTADVLTRARLSLVSRVRDLLGAVDYGDDSSGRRNLGLPLEVVNALSQAPRGVVGEATNDNRRFEPLKKLVAQSSIEESDSARRSRAILHAYAFRKFEAGNRALIAALGWSTTSFISPVESSDVDEGQELAQLEELWRPHASPAELELLYLALDRALPKRRLRLHATRRGWPLQSAASRRSAGSSSAGRPRA